MNINRKENKMIPNEKIELAEKIANPYFGNLIEAAHKKGFTAGVRFAESELSTEVESAYNRGLSDGQKITESAIQQIAIEFAEWCDKYYYSRHNNKDKEKWLCFDSNGNKLYTTAELFDKFMAERSNP